MSRWVFDTIWVVAGVLGIVLTVMYFRAAQKLYAQDKKHAPGRQDVELTGEPPSSEHSSDIVS